MKEVTEWWEEVVGAQGPWVVLGKGPSFARREEFDLRPYRVMTLNHAIREMKADVAHMVDMDVVAHCGEEISQNAQFLLMPRFPHLNNGPAPDRPLETFFAEHPVLERLDAEGRLVWYNLEGAPSIPGSPLVPRAAFSGAIAVHILAMLGVRRVRTLGVDGGRTYAPTFKDLAGVTLLANGQSHFGPQFERIADSVRRFGVDYAPLTGDTPAWRTTMYLYFLRRRIKDVLRPLRDILRRQRMRAL